MNLHQIVTTTRTVSCACGAAPDRPCTCGPAGVHLARVAHARRAGLIEAADFAEAIADADVFTGYTVVTDPQAVTP